MTGTALTEEQEFQQIYGMDVVEIPTNRPMIRIDHPDVIYKTAAAKYNAIIEQILECHERRQPVLVGTISIEKSELLGKMLKKAQSPVQYPQRKNTMKKRGGDRRAGRADRHHHHRHQHGRPRHRHQASGQSGIPGQTGK